MHCAVLLAAILPLSLVWWPIGAAVADNGDGPVDCTWQTDAYAFDLSAFYWAQYGPGGVGDFNFSDPSGTRSYKFAMCGEVTEYKCRMDEGAVCEYIAATSTTHLLGRWLYSGVTFNYLPDAGELQLSMADGDYPGCAPGKHRNVTISMHCSTDKNEVLPKVQPVMEIADNCTYYVRMTSVAACPTAIGPGNGGGGGGLSGGSVFIIVVIVVTVVYFAAGFAYKSLVKGTRGVESIPHVDYWRDLPGLVADGFRFVFAKIRGIFFSSTPATNYETIH